MRWKRVIIDAYNHAHMYKHVYELLVNSKGTHTGVLYGFLNMINKINTMFFPDEIIVVWDCDPPNVRKIIDPTYKQARVKKLATLSKEKERRDKIFHEQEVPMVQLALRKLGIPQIKVPYLEADDVIALCVQCGQDTGEWIIASNDKDYVQWVKKDHCRLYTPSTDQLFYQDKDGRVKGGVTEFGTSLPSPECYAIWRCITGDKSDSITGIEGVGVGTVSKVFENTPPITSLRTADDVIQYMKGGTYCGFRAEKIQKVVNANSRHRQEFMERLSLMRPTPEGLHYTLSKLPERHKNKHSEEDHKAAINFLMACMKPDFKKKKWRADDAYYLTNRKSEVNPFVMFLRRHNFEMGYQKTDWYPFLKSMQALDMRRRLWHKHTKWSPLDRRWTF